MYRDQKSFVCHLETDGLNLGSRVIELFALPVAGLTKP